MRYVKCVSKSVKGLTIDKIYEVKFLEMNFSFIRLSIIDDDGKEVYFNITGDKIFIEAKLEARNKVINEILL